jgi:O-antigen ligase/Flp pilus assembly protein TadD
MQLETRQNIKLINQDSLISKLDFPKLSFYLLALGIGGSVLIVNPFGFQIYELIKVNFFRLFLLLAAFIWLVNLLFKQPKIFTDRFGILLLIWLVVGVLSTLFSVSPITSLFGWFRRFDGLISQTSYFLLFFLAYQLFKASKRRISKLWEIIFSVSIFLALVGYLEIAGILNMPKSGTDPYRTVATFGNAGFLAGYLCLILPLALAISLDKQRSKNQRQIAGAALILLAPFLFSAASVSAWLGMLVGLVLIAIFYFRNRRNRFTIFILTTFILLAIVASSFYLFKNNHWQSKVRARLLYWQTSIQIIKERPLLGYGLDTFALTYPQFRPKDWLTRDKEGAPVSKVHNNLLQVTASEGLLGLAIYLLILIWLFYQGNSFLRKQNRAMERSQVVGLLSSLAAYLIFKQFYFSIYSLEPIFWLESAALLAYASKPKEAQLIFPKLTKPLVLVVTGGLLIVSLIFLDCQQLADYHFYQSFKAANKQNWDKVVAEVQRSVSLDPTEVRYQMYLGRSLAIQAEEEKDLAKFKKAEQVYVKLLKLCPTYAEAHLDLGDAYLREANIFSSRTARKAVVSYKKAREVAKFSPITLSRLGQAYARLGKYQLARYYFSRALKLDPDNPGTYKRLSWVLDKLGRKAEAKIIANKAKHLTGNGGKVSI